MLRRLLNPDGVTERSSPQPFFPNITLKKKILLESPGSNLESEILKAADRRDQGGARPCRPSGRRGDYGAGKEAGGVPCCGLRGPGWIQILQAESWPSTSLWVQHQFWRESGGRLPSSPRLGHEVWISPAPGPSRMTTSRQLYHGWHSPWGPGCRSV